MKELGKREKYADMGLAEDMGKRRAQCVRLFFEQRFAQTVTAKNSADESKTAGFQDGRRAWTIDYSNPDKLIISIMANTGRARDKVLLKLTVDSGDHPFIDYYVGPAPESYTPGAKSSRHINDPFATGMARRIILKIP